MRLPFGFQQLLTTVAFCTSHELLVEGQPRGEADAALQSTSKYASEHTILWLVPLYSVVDFVLSLCSLFHLLIDRCVRFCTLFDLRSCHFLQVSNVREADVRRRSRRASDPCFVSVLREQTAHVVIVPVHPLISSFLVSHPGLGACITTVEIEQFQTWKGHPHRAALTMVC